MFIKIHRMFAGSLLVALLLLVASPVAAQNWVDGQIAILEDTTGLILPAEPMCDNILFANPPCINHAGMAFYAEHPDNYDMLMLFTNKNMASMQMGFPVQKAAQGIGLDGTPHLYNPGMVGSAGRLRQFVIMGSLPSLPNNPADQVSMLIRITGIELMAHELGHQWMSWIMLDLDNGVGPIGVLRGFENDKPNGHWSCWFNNHGSVMYGGNLEDNGDGTFTDHGGNRKYSQLDQYLMGLRTADEVDPMFYVNVDGTNEGCPAMPMAEGGTNTYTGARVDFDMEDIIRANGPRVPELDNCHIKIGFAIVYSTGFPPTDADIAKVEAYRQAIEAWWPGGTDNRSSIDTRIDGCGTGTEACSGETSAQCGTGPDGDENEDGDSDIPCTFNDFRCQDENTVEICNQSGEWEYLMDCEAGQQCVNGECVDAIDGDAEDSESNPPDGDNSPDGDSNSDGDQSSSDGDYQSTDGDQHYSDGDVYYPVGGNDEDNNGADDGSIGCGQAEASGLFIAALGLLLVFFSRKRQSV